MTSEKSYKDRPWLPWQRNLGQNGSLVWEISPRCLRLVGGFGGWAIERRQSNSTTTNRCCHGNENLKQNRQ